MKAYGVYCRDQSRRIAGDERDPFSQCMTAMARAARDEKLSATQACKTMSGEHVEGERGTPFSRCVRAAAQLKKEAQQG